MTARCFTVVEQAGYIGERDVISFPHWREAASYVEKTYDADERDQFHADCLHVDIRQDWTDATGDHQEYVC